MATGLRAMRSAVKQMPGAVPAYRYMRARLFGQAVRRRIFEHYYLTNAWGDAESRSGCGSNLPETAVIRAELPRLLRQLRVTSLLDAPCGDFHWMQTVDLGAIAYIGADIVEPLVAANQRRYGGPSRRFLRLDLVRDELPPVDLILCRDLLVHLCFTEIHAAIRNLRRSGATWLLTTTYPTRAANDDTATGGWRRLNLERAPFGFAKPAALIDEHCTEEGGRRRDKSLALWRIADLPQRVPSLQFRYRWPGLARPREDCALPASG
ncbi:MAG TPA: class I SAM-dependent methyltransferase [Stellaceae bacterium]|nr:class I SAM-dependent methyltransferase [Stellaceae bacterium]